MPAKTAVIIPARYASTRFPGKPLHMIAGKPLIQHVWERCGRAKGVDAVIVATDDERIGETAFNFGAEVSFTSPKHCSGTDRVAEVAENLRGFGQIINVQGDEPLIDPALVTRLGEVLADDSCVGMVRAAYVLASEADVLNPNIVKVILDRNSDALYFSRSPIPFVRNPVSAKPVTFYRHQGIYGYSTKLRLQFVKWRPGILEQAEQLEQLRALENGARIRVVLTKHSAVGVDTPEDAVAVERLLTSS